MDQKKLTFIFSRYLVLILLGIPSLLIFYLIFTPLTFYPVFFVLQRLYEATITTGNTTIACNIISLTGFPPNILSKIACINTTILFKGYFASIIPACIAGSAYYLLTILNLTTPMETKTRIKSLVFLLTTFLFLNIIRILTFAILFVKKGYAYFDIVHAATWYFGSTILVVLIWFVNILIFKIQAIPVYTDFKDISKEIFNKNPSKIRKKEFVK